MKEIPSVRTASSLLPLNGLLTPTMPHLTWLISLTRYDLALRLARNAAHAVPLLLNRSHARLQSAHFDAALADANAVLDMSLNKPPEKAVFRAARALYGLRRFKECLEACESLLGQYPGNKAGVEVRLSTFGRG